MICNKIKYSSEVEALKALSTLKNHRKEKRFYFHNDCGCFHLTSQSKIVRYQSYLKDKDKNIPLLNPKISLNEYFLRGNR